jgi:hypothetical protein
MIAADKEPINVALNVFIRIPAPENPQWILNKILQRCQPSLTIVNRFALDQTKRRDMLLVSPDRRGRIAGLCATANAPAA